MKVVIARVGGQDEDEPSGEWDNLRGYLPIVETSRRGVWVGLNFPGHPWWALAVHVVAAEGTVAVAEIRIHPRGPGRVSEVPYAWDEKAAVPAGGVTTRMLRDVRMRRLVDLARDVARTFGAATSPLIPPGTYFVNPTLARAARQPVRRGARGDRLDLLRYAMLAARYCEFLAQGSRNPTKDMADAEGSGWKPADISNLLHKARKYGLLTSAPKGKAGGTLTPKAIELLEKGGSPALQTTQGEGRSGRRV